MEALTSKIDSQYKDIKGEMKEMREGCNNCGGNHTSSECDDQPMNGPKEGEANYVQEGYRRGGYRGNYYGRNSRNWQDRQQRDNNHDSQPRSDNPTPPNSDKKPEETDFEKMMREFVTAQKSTNEFVKTQFFNLKTKVKQGQKNHQASIQDLEHKFGRLSNQFSSRPPGALPSNTQSNPKPTSSGSNNKAYRPPPTRNEHINVVFTRTGLSYDPPQNPNQTTIIHDDSEDEDEAEKEDTPKTTIKEKTIQPVKPYTPKIPYPQSLKKERMEERYKKFVEMIKEVRINVPLVDVLAGMPNYGKFLKELLNNKNKLEQISATFLNEECSAIVQKKTPPKLGDPGSFLIPCTLGNNITCDALADLGASINLMPYSFYSKLSINTLKPTKISIRLAQHKYNNEGSF
ncbi:hypothetical protein CTI12_AA594230 [Artemisia annua]|uniref:Reverse transcriptase domain-containing protein n=1 Tax=Artemisia annua TaxID=35608 RepID=A0A2U1KJZ6_ARTAN|nr:hypothetical protein CTI12_AA594230 [Artemisia annua]